jgi:hypothetical protein
MKSFEKFFFVRNKNKCFLCLTEIFFFIEDKKQMISKELDTLVSAKKFISLFFESLFYSLARTPRVQTYPSSLEFTVEFFSLA